MSGEMRSNVQATSLQTRDVITLTARLAQILAEEVDLLSEMKVSKIEALQQEKLFLTSALESQRKMMDKHPELRETIPSQDKQDLREVVEVFNDILAENHRKLTIAKEVNHKIVEAITSVVRQSTQSNAYSGKGATAQANFEVLSVTLDKQI